MLNLTSVYRILLLASLLLVSAVQAQDKPNILIIWGDDVGPYNISAYNMGVMGYKTPNIDRIAEEGMIFTDPALQKIPLSTDSPNFAIADFLPYHR